MNMIFGSVARQPLIILMAEAIPVLAFFLRKLLAALSFLIPSRAATIFIRNIINGVIKRSKEDLSVRRTDILQLILDAEEADGSGRKSLTGHEVIAQSVIFRAAQLCGSSLTCWATMLDSC